MRPRAASALVVLFATLSLVSGCAAGTDVDPNRSKDDAKAIAQAGESSIAALIPAQMTVTVDQHEKGTLLSCQGDHNYTWSGGTEITVATNEDVTSAIERIAAIDDQGWRGQRETAASGGPRAVLYGPDGDSYVVDGLPDRPLVRIVSSSPCFHLPDGEYPESF